MPGVFEVMGPIMIGPSSSHTAGAVKLGQMARLILGEQPARIIIRLYGSFAATHRGHGTDLALVAGLLGMSVDDERIVRSWVLAREAGIDLRLETRDTPPEHPNTVEFVLTDRQGREVFIRGVSIGGGNIVVTAIDDFTVQLTGEYPTLITRHRDQPGMVSEVTGVLALHHVNIAFLRLARAEKGAAALMVVETDQQIPDDAYRQIEKTPGILAVRRIPPLSSFTGR